jgi:hypothetical protein
MKSISTFLGILFGFAIFVHVVATPGPSSEDEGSAQSPHHSKCCRALFNYVVLADNTLQPPHAITEAHIRLLLEFHAVNVKEVIDFIVNSCV